MDQLLQEKSIVDKEGMIEVLPNIKTNARHLSWLIDRMAHPEGNAWIWLRRISNILTIPAFIGIILLLLGA